MRENITKKKIKIYASKSKIVAYSAIKLISNCGRMATEIVVGCVRQCRRDEISCAPKRWLNIRKGGFGLLQPHFRRKTVPLRKPKNFEKMDDLLRICVIERGIPCGTKGAAPHLSFTSTGLQDGGAPCGRFPAPFEKM